MTAPSRRERPLFLLALVLLGIVAGVCVSLGFWQLDRAAERDALHEAIQQGRQQAPVLVSASLGADDYIPWQAVVAHGRWSPEHTVLIENRNLDGRPGYWVATPLMLEPPPIPSSRNDAVSAGSAEIGAIVGGTSGSARTGERQSSEFLARGPVAPDTAAVLVLRGWLPRDMRAQGALPAIPQEPGLLTLHGELLTHVPRIFELWEWAGGKPSSLPATLPSGDVPLAQVQNLELDAYAAATGLRLLPAVLAQTKDTIFAGSAGAALDAQPTDRQPTDGPQQVLQRDWPGPSVDSDQNRGYALQWFGFSAIAIIAAVIMVWRRLRRHVSKKHEHGDVPASNKEIR